jgi:hypothetical protein
MQFIIFWNFDLVFPVTFFVDNILGRFSLPVGGMSGDVVGGATLRFVVAMRYAIAFWFFGGTIWLCAGCGSWCSG